MTLAIDLNATEFDLFFPSTATLDETCRALKTNQENETANVTSVEGVKVERQDNTEVNVNLAHFKRATSVLDVSDDLLCIDVSTVAGAAAAAANRTHVKIGPPSQPFKIWVQDKLTTIQVFARKTPS